MSGKPVKGSAAGKPARTTLRWIDWVGPPNAQGVFLLIGEAEGRPGKTLFRATLPKA